MIKIRSSMLKIFIVLGIMISVLACSVLSGSSDSTTPTLEPTPTPTSLIGVESVTPTPVTNVCEGLSGTLEMQVLVGPADAVGLEPVAVGDIPFSVISENGVCLVQGGGGITYEDVLEKEWGTYTVKFDMDTDVQGSCESDDQTGTLDVTVVASGEQMVEVRAEGFQGDYPWSGSHTLDLSFPIEEGASASGEGWAFVLHLN
jgi:hypothetical protein